MSDILRMECVRLRPWLIYIAKHSYVPDIDPFLMAGILLRESGAGYAPGYYPKGVIEGWGDNGRAYSPWQFDIRDPSNVHWIGTKESKTFDGQTERAAMWLYEARNMLSWALEGQTLVRGMIASYNADARKVLHCASLCDVDRCTTGRDYSQWVLDKAEALKKYNPNLFNEAANGIV